MEQTMRKLNIDGKVFDIEDAEARDGVRKLEASIGIVRPLELTLEDLAYIENLYLKADGSTAGIHSDMYRTTDYIAVMEGDALTFSLRGCGTLAAMAFYDKGKSHIRSILYEGDYGAMTTLDGEAVVEAGEAYMRLFYYGRNENAYRSYFTFVREGRESSIQDKEARVGVAAVKDALGLIEGEELFLENIPYKEGEYIERDGVQLHRPVAGQDYYRVTDPISVLAGDELTYALEVGIADFPAIACYDVFDGYVKSSSMIYEPYEGGVAGGRGYTHGSMTVPDGIAYIKICYTVGHEGIGVAPSTLTISRIPRYKAQEDIRRLEKAAELERASRVNVKELGAAGNGETDDTEAIQAALDAGGVIYFPPGRYKVSRTLMAVTPCRIVMEGQYPCSFGGDFPSGNTGGIVYRADYGARIETYATGCGLMIGDGVCVDGLAIRAMEGFMGIIVKFDGSLGYRTYPSQVRLCHMKIDRGGMDNHAAESGEFPYQIDVESYLDINPHGSYGVIVEDVVLGGNFSTQLAHYGLRSVPTKWANNIKLRDIVIEVGADYPLYIDGSKALDDAGKRSSLSSWMLENISIQMYAFEDEYTQGRIRTHVTGAYLRDLYRAYISGCVLWDLNPDKLSSGLPVDATALTPESETTAVGNDAYFNALDTTTGLTVTEVRDTVDRWMEDHMAGGRIPATHNLFDPSEAVTKETIGDINIGQDQGNAFGSSTYLSGLIPAKVGDVVRLYMNSPHENSNVLPTWPGVYEYDASNNYLTSHDVVAATVTVSDTQTAYIRVQAYVPAIFGHPEKVMVTLNYVPTEFEAFSLNEWKGISEYVVLISPNGTEYRLAVGDDGVLSAVPVE